MDNVLTVIYFYRKTQIQNAYLEDSEYPFEAIFYDAVTRVK